MNTNPLSQAKILIIDDEKANIRFLEIVLDQAGYVHVSSTTESREALTLFQGIRPDIVLLDLTMPHLDGFEVLQELHGPLGDETVPVLVLTADVTPVSKHRALTGSANDYLCKPLDEVEVLLRIRNLLYTRFHNELLESKVRERTRELEMAQLETLQRLAQAAEYRDDDTGQHTRRVGATCGCIAEKLGFTAKQVELIIRAAPLHDVGKIGIADNILLKRGKLTEEESEIMKSHVVVGATMLSGSSSPWLQMAEEIALTHHERWDGHGYPRGLAGGDIPLIGRIAAVADVFDALTHERPYKNAWPITEAVNEIAAQSGRQFDEQVVRAFLTLNHDALV